MNALLVCAAPFNAPEGWLTDIASAHDLVVGVDGGAAHCLSEGIVPDLVVGDLDSLESCLLKQLVDRGIEIERFSADKDVTDLDLAFESARGRGVDSVTVVAAYGGRLDHTLGVTGSLMRAVDLRPCLEAPDMRGWVLGPSYRASLGLSGEESTVSVIALGSSAVVSVNGGRWNLDTAEIKPFESLGLSNTIAGGSLVVMVHSGEVLVLSVCANGKGLARKTG